MSDRHNPSAVKKQLLEDSEYLVDLIYALEEAIGREDEKSSEAVIRELDQLGGKLTDLIPDLEEDDSAFAWFMMGSLCSALRMWPEAEKTYRLALETWPDHVGLLNEFFICLMQMEKYDEAAEVIQKSIETGGETPELLQHYAAVLVKRGKTEEAKILLINCMARFPSDSHARELIDEIERHYK